MSAQRTSFANDENSLTTSAMTSAAPALLVKRLEVWNFAGVEHAKIEPQTPGVTVIHGPNESGKSTFVNAFQLLLNPSYRRDTQAKDVIKYKTRNKDLAFTVEADLVVGEYDLTMRKEFKKPGGQSILTIHAPRLENLSGNEAEDRFHEILAEKVDLGLRGALTVEQGDDLGKVIPMQVTSLSGAMAEAVSDVDANQSEQGAKENGTQLFSDEAEERILRAVQQEFLRYFTQTGRPSKLVKELQRAANDSQAALVEAQQRYDNALDLITSLESSQRKRQKIREDRPAAVAAVEAAVANLKSAESRDLQLTQAQSQVEYAKLTQQNAQDALDTRSALIRERESLADKVVRLAETHKKAAQAAQEEATALDRVRAEVAQSRARVDAIRAWQQAASAVQTTLQRDQQLTRENQLLNDLKELQTQREELHTSVAEALPPKVGQAVRDAAAHYRAELRVLESVSTQVKVTGPEGARFTEEGRDIELSTETHTTCITTARTFGFGEFNVEVCPHDDRSEAQDSADRALKKLQNAARKAKLDAPTVLAGGNSLTPDALDAILRQVDTKDSVRTELEEKLRALDSSIARITAGRTAAEVQVSIESLTSFIDATRSEAAESVQVAKDAEGDSSVEFPGREVVEAVVESDDADSTVPGKNRSAETTAQTDGDALDEDFGSCLELLDQATRELKDQHERAEDAALQAQNRREELAGTPQAIALERASSELDVHTERLETLDEQLAAQRENSSDEDVASALEKAKEKLTQAERAARELHEQFQGVDSVADAQLKLESATTARDSLEQRERSLGEDIVAYSTELNNSATAKQDVDDARIVAEKDAATYAEAQRKGAAVKLLLDELVKAREEKQAKYQEPFKEQFEALARFTFGSEAEFTFDQDLRVSARLRGGLSLDHDVLSGGAQEQIGLLTRLTVATLVGQGGAVPIILDDVLGNSDDQRVEGMGLALGSVGREHQIIVFTCAPERFEGVPRAKVLSMAEAKRG